MCVVFVCYMRGRGDSKENYVVSILADLTFCYHYVVGERPSEVLREFKCVRP